MNAIAIEVKILHPDPTFGPDIRTQAECFNAAVLKILEASPIETWPGILTEDAKGALTGSDGRLWPTLVGRIGDYFVVGISLPKPLQGTWGLARIRRVGYGSGSPGPMVPGGVA